MSTISAGTSNTTSLIYTGDTTGNLMFQTNGTTEAMRIDTSGNVGVGTSSPGAKLDVTVASGVNLQLTKSSGAAITFNDGAIRAAFQGINTADGLTIHTGSAFTERVRITPTELSLTGLQGIKFPATQNPSSDANTLDDYEEGTWTPTWSTGTATYGSRVGRYTKIGDVVHYLCKLESLTVSGMSTAYINGLPFTASSVNAQGYTTGSTFCVIGFENLGSAGLAPQIGPGATQIQLYVVTQGSGANYGALSASDINEGSTVNITVAGFYYV